MVGGEWLEAFEQGRDPDAFEGPLWKDQRFEFDSVGNFSAGSQSNPYHPNAVSEAETLVGDAADNTVLSVKAHAQLVELVALLTPSLDGDDKMEFSALGDSTACYVQPVATAVALGSDGDYYVSELTGAAPGFSLATACRASGEPAMAQSN